MRKEIVIFLVLLLLFSCSPPGNVITIVYDAQPSSLDPHLRKEIVTISILGNIYETLVAFDKNMKMIPCLAEYWERKDSLTWRFSLRKNVRFHNHKILQTDDVIYSLYRTIYLAESEYKGLKNFIDTIIPEGQNMVMIKLKSPFAFLLYELADIFIIPAGLEPQNSQTCGTGPYMLTRIDKENIEMAAFAEYWGKKVPIKVVKIKFVPEIEKRIEALNNNEADLITYIPLSCIKDLTRIIHTDFV